MNVNVPVERETLERLAERLEAARGGVEIGFFEGDEHYSGYSMAGLAGLLTKGFRTANPRTGAAGAAPARPFIRQLLDAERERIIRFALDALRQYAEGTAYADIDAVWERIGAEVADIMRDFALAGRITPGNAASTIRKKGFDKPWVWHGDLIGSIRHNVL